MIVREGGIWVADKKKKKFHTKLIKDKGPSIDILIGLEFFDNKHNSFKLY